MQSCCYLTREPSEVRCGSLGCLLGPCGCTGIYAGLPLSDPGTFRGQVWIPGKLITSLWMHKNLCRVGIRRPGNLPGSAKDQTCPCIFLIGPRPSGPACQCVADYTTSILACLARHIQIPVRFPRSLPIPLDSMQQIPRKFLEVFNIPRFFQIPTGSCDLNRKPLGFLRMQ